MKLNGNEVMLYVELIDVQTDTNLMSATYSRQMQNLVTLRSDVAKDVVKKMLLSISADDRRKLAENGTEDGEAYGLYLHGRSEWNKRTPEGLMQAADFFTKATEKDPNYARAYAGLAETYVLYTLFNVRSPKDSMPQAKAAALRALEIDRDDSLAKAKAHVALGAYLSNFAWNQPAAVNEFRLAIEIHPNYETAYHWLGNMPLQAMGKFDEAIASGRRAEELDSNSPIISADTAQNLFFARRYDEAIEQFNRALTIDPNYHYALYYLGATYHAKRMYAEAIAKYRKAQALEVTPDPYVKALLARSLVKAGQRGEAVKLLIELKSESEHRYVQNVVFALVYGALGEKRLAFEALEKDVEERSIYPAYFAVDPTYDDLRDDSRFAKLLRQVESAKME
jgi:tetratricopeptide (TPR) repeat protein